MSKGSDKRLHRAEGALKAAILIGAVILMGGRPAFGQEGIVVRDLEEPDSAVAAALSEAPEATKAEPAVETPAAEVLEAPKADPSVVAAPELVRTQTAEVEPPVETPKAPKIESVRVVTAESVIAGAEWASTNVVKDLFDPGMILPPKPSEKNKTIRDVVGSVTKSVRKSYFLISTNSTAALDGPYTADFGQAQMEWQRVLQYVLNPLGLNFTEDQEIVLIGSIVEVEAKRKSIAQERLRNNCAPISFSSNVAQGGTDLRTAILEIGRKANVFINLDYVNPAELGPVAQTTLGAPELSVEEIAGKEGAPAAAPTYKRTTVCTPEGQPVEWRVVLRKVLNPAGYDFLERDGGVDVASFAQIAAWKTEEQNAKPMEARVVRIYHANPDTIVERIAAMKLLNHPNASISVSRKSDEKSSTFTGGQAGIAIASGTQVGASSIGSGSAFGNLKRPLTPPGVVIYDIAENLDNVEKTIRLLDVREKQVLIEALVLDLNDGFARELGVKWSGLGSKGSSFQLGRVTGGMSKDYTKHRESENSYEWTRTDTRTGTYNYQGTSSQSRNRDIARSDAPTENNWSQGSAENHELTQNASRDVLDTATDIGRNTTQTLRESLSSYGVLLGPLDFTAVLSLVSENNDNRVLSSPVLVIGDHSEAVIQVGEAEPIPVTRVSYIGDNNQNVERETEWQILMTGVTLWVAPEVTEDGKGVRLSVHPQITNPDGAVTGPDGSSYPRVVTRELDTRVTVPSGDTLMLGGLIKTDEHDVITKVPFLGDIPFLGRLFRHRGKEKQQRNLVILIRPTVLDDDDPDSGFEDPAMKIIDPMMSRAGRNLALPEEDRKMETREDRIKRVFNWRKKDTSDATPVEEGAGGEISANSAPPPTSDAEPDKVEE